MSACVETFYLFLHKVTTSSRGLHAASSFSTPLHTPLAKLVQNSDLPSTKKSFFLVHSSELCIHRLSKVTKRLRVARAPTLGCAIADSIVTSHEGVACGPPVLSITARCND